MGCRKESDRLPQDTHYIPRFRQNEGASHLRCNPLSASNIWKMHNWHMMDPCKMT
jgi:hypothetical protein